MNVQKIDRILADTAYVRMGGSAEELRCAEYLKAICAELGREAVIEPFEVDMATIKEAKLFIDGSEITCKGYLCAGTAEVEADLYYLTNTDSYSLKQCKGKIVMIDGYMGYWMYQDILENGAVGFITYDGNANYADRDIDQRELRAYVSKGNKLPGVNINAKDAIEIIRSGAKKAKIVLCQDEYKGESRNVVMELPGATDEWIVLTAHYDSTSLSTGAYDNMSGSIGLLGIAENFAKKPHRYGLRFVWCGSEERGLLGSKAYCEAHEEELKNVVLNINLDMIGCIMGKFIACCTSEEKLVHYIQYFGSEMGWGIAARDGVYSSDSTPFADKGVPAVSFARIAPNNTATIHNSYDTLAVMKAEQLAKDIDFLNAFTDRMANAVQCPVAREMPEKMKEKLDYYLCRKREPENK
ncbi:MAG: Zn-dependent exopeptidase M28 [Lachnospiraceae bacterium]|nr:Zn-dependent exopeptidase M28 [Lachnospiraceae bacterium]